MFSIVRNLLTAFCLIFATVTQAQYSKMTVLGDSLSNIANLLDMGAVPF